MSLYNAADEEYTSVIQHYLGLPWLCIVNRNDDDIDCGTLYRYLWKRWWWWLGTSSRLPLAAIIPSSISSSIISSLILQP